MKKILFFLLFISFINACNNPDKARENFLNAKKYYKKNQLDKAEQLLVQTIQDDDDFINAHLMLAKVYFFQSKLDKAMKSIDNILEIDDNHIAALYWKARIISIKDKNDKQKIEVAIKCLKKVILINNHHIPARHLLALLYEKNKMYKEAMYEYLFTLYEEKLLLDVRTNLSILYKKLGLSDKANSEINKAMGIAKILNIKKDNLIKIQEEFKNDKKQ